MQPDDHRRGDGESLAVSRYLDLLGAVDRLAAVRSSADADEKNTLEFLRAAALDRAGRHDEAWRALERLLALPLERLTERTVVEPVRRSPAPGRRMRVPLRNRSRRPPCRSFPCASCSTMPPSRSP